MDVFLQKFLEVPTDNSNVNTEEWQWDPEGIGAKEIYASGAATNTRQSTYAGEKDDRQDSDRPNEGLFAA